MMARKYLIILLTGWLLFSGTSALADTRNETFEIGILVTKRSPLALSFVKKLKSELRASHIDFVSPDTRYDLILTLGAAAFQKRMDELNNQADNQKIVQIPTLAIYISKIAFTRISTSKDRVSAPQCNCSAIYSSAPLERQALLAHSLLPNAGHIAILSSFEKDYYKKVATIMSSLGFKPTVYQIQDFDSFNQLLLTALTHNDFILGTEDPNIYSSKTIKQLLLTAYRHNKVLIGPSPAFVKAGALATSFSNFNQTLKFTKRQIRSYRRELKLPEPATPEEFSLKINKQVARSLNIYLKQEAQVRLEIEKELNHVKH